MTAYLIISLALWSLSAWIGFKATPTQPRVPQGAYVFVFLLYCGMAAWAFILLINLWEMQS